MSLRNCVRLALIAGATLFDASMASAQNELPGLIAADTVLTAANSPYSAPGTVLVAATLTIEPGVRIEFAEGASLHVTGQLDAAGTALDPIIFSKTTDAAHWGAICLDTPTGLSSIEHAIVEYGSNATTLDPYCQAAVSSSGQDVTVSHLTFRHNRDVSFFTLGANNVTVSHSLFEASNGKEHLNVQYANGIVIVEDSEFFGAKASNADSIDYDYVANGFIRRNIIHDSPDDCLDIGNETTAVLEDNVINNCHDKAFAVGTLVNSVTVFRNIITNSTIGLRIADGSDAVADRNTFYNVAIPVQAATGGSADIRNSIFAGSGNDIQVTGGATATIEYSVFPDSAPHPGLGNVTGDPLFVNPDSADFRLMEGSLAIDVGDPWSGYDPDGTIADAGAIPFFQDNDVLAVPSLRIRLALQGSFSGGSAMSTSLGDLVPMQQPFSGMPWDYEGSEVRPEQTADLVDWVLVELRSGDGSLMDTKAALLRSDGTVVETDGDGLTYAGLGAGIYTVVIRHRNHLAISGIFELVESGNALNWVRR